MTRSSGAQSRPPPHAIDGVRPELYIGAMKLLLENLPESLKDEAEAIAQCLEAFARVRPIHHVYLFGSHARGEAGPESDVDLCIVADGAERQFEAARTFREAVWEIWPRPAFTLIPITPDRLAEKRRVRDHFFQTVLEEGVLLAEED